MLQATSFSLRLLPCWAAFDVAPGNYHLAFGFCLVGHLLLPFLICVIRSYQFHIEMTLCPCGQLHKSLTYSWAGPFYFYLIHFNGCIFFPLYNRLRKSHSSCLVECFDFSILFWVGRRNTLCIYLILYSKHWVHVCQSQILHVLLLKAIYLGLIKQG